MSEKRDWNALVRARLGSPTGDPARNADIVAELAQHAAEHFAELVAGGTAETAAERIALAPLDDPERVAREIARADRPRSAAPEPPSSDRESWSIDLWRDMRYATRLLAAAPGFSAVAIVTLALGIGANTIIFSVVQAVLLRPLPYQDPDRLVYIGDAGGSGQPGNVGFATFQDWKSQNHVFDEMAAIRSWAPTLAMGGEPERVAGLRVSANFFRLLGVRPAIGRDFTPADDTPAHWRVVIISDRLWRRRFGADPSIVGRKVSMSDQSYEVIGIMPAAFEPLISEHFYQSADIWAALGYDPSLSYACRSCQHLKGFARLKTTTTVDSATAEMTRIHAALRERFPDDYARSTSVALKKLADEFSGNIRPALTALTGAVGFVLLIACANVANLLLARNARRQHDLGLRAALGADRARILRQLLVESATLAILGGVLGLSIGAVAIPVLIGLTPVQIPRLEQARVDVSVAAFTLMLSMATTFGFGLLPAIRASRIDLSGAIAGDARRTSSAPTSLARKLLIGVDVALAVVLLAGAGLMIRSVGRLLGVDPGFSPDGVLTMQISILGERYREDAVTVRTIDQMLERIRTVPGVMHAAMAGQIPLGGNGDTWGFHVVGRPPSPDDPNVERYSVTPEYFDVMRIPVVRGRLITPADRADTERVMVVGDYTAKSIWPDSDPIGQRVKIGGNDGPTYTVVGVAGDVRHRELAAPPTRQMYLAHTQFTDSYLTVVVRTAREPSSVVADVRRAIWSVAPDVPIFQVATLNDLVQKSLGPRRFLMRLLALFSAVALLMTAVGVYGVIAYSVAERAREFGVRIALGASRSNLARLVMRSGLAVVAGGLVAGCLLAFAATRYLQASLFRVSPTDPVTFVAVAGVLLTVASAAHVVPIMRATRVDPAVALRQE